jgi:hypothetical protein
MGLRVDSVIAHNPPSTAGLGGKAPLNGAHHVAVLRVVFAPATSARMKLYLHGLPSKQECIGEEPPMPRSPVPSNIRCTRSGWAAAVVAVLLMATFTPVQWLRGRLPRWSSPSIALSAWLDPWESSRRSARNVVVPSGGWLPYELPSSFREFDPLFPLEEHAPRSLDDLRQSPPASWETVDAQELSSEDRKQYELKLVLPDE